MHANCLRVVVCGPDAVVAKVNVTWSQVVKEAVIFGRVARDRVKLLTPGRTLIGRSNSNSFGKKISEVTLKMQLGSLTLDRLLVKSGGSFVGAASDFALCTSSRRQLMYLPLQVLLFLKFA